ncbi:MAG: laminin G, partial [Bacteroidota bacterium]
MNDFQKIFFIAWLITAQTIVHGQQIVIDRIAQMPDQPQPYFMRSWKTVAKGYDSLVFNLTASGTYLPLNTLNSNTMNYPGSQSFKLQTYVGSPDFGGEGINCLPAVIGAELAGLDKRNQDGVDWVSMCREWFNTLPSEQIYLNGPRASSGDDWWYETMPNVFFFQLYDLHPEISEFQIQSSIIADRMLASVRGMGGSAAPWTIPNMDHRAWKFSTMTPYDNDVHEPEASGAIAWLLYQEFTKTGEKKYRIGAELAMEFLNARSLNPSYELQLSYGTYLAARMNAEIGTQYNLQKLFTWCFDVGPLRSWGATVGKWGIYDCSGLIGEVNQFDPGYAFLMNTFQQVGALTPVARYDDRYASAIGKWVLNAANAARLFYPKFLPDSLQDSRTWSVQYDPHSYIGHEAMKQSQSNVSPYATGDAMKNNWAETNLALYGSSHVGYLASIVDTTNVPMVLQLDLLATDFGHQPAYPTYLYYNPFDSTVSVSINAGAGSADLYDAAANAFVKTNVSGETSFDIPTHTARVVVLTPSGGTVSYSNGKMA